MYSFVSCVFSVSGPVEYDPEYQLIVQANNLTVEIDNEISMSELYMYYFYQKVCFNWQLDLIHLFLIDLLDFHVLS